MVRVGHTGNICYVLHVQETHGMYGACRERMVCVAHAGNAWHGLVVYAVRKHTAKFNTKIDAKLHAEFGFVIRFTHLYVFVGLLGNPLVSWGSTWFLYAI